MAQLTSADVDRAISIAERWQATAERQGKKDAAKDAALIVKVLRTLSGK